MTAKNKQLHENKGLELSQLCQVHLSSHLHGQVLHMTIFYLTSALGKKLARQLLNKCTCQGKNCNFSSIYPNLHEQNKLHKEKLSKKTCSCKCGLSCDIEKGSEASMPDLVYGIDNLYETWMPVLGGGNDNF